MNLLAAAPPPELTILRQQYEKVFAERVTTVHEAALTELDGKFTTALDNAIAQAKASGDLPTVLALQADQKLLAEKQPLPAGDAEDAPEALKKLRAIYREQLARLVEQRAANTAALHSPYSARLQELEATLTKNDRVEEAKTVMDYRASLANTLAQVTPTVTVTPPPPTASATMPVAPAKNLPKGDDRKAAEWVLSLSGQVQIAGDASPIASSADLPRGQLSLSAIYFTSPLPEIADADFDRLANLHALKKFEASGGGSQSDEALRFLSTCPSLTAIDIQNWPTLEGRWLGYLAPLEQLNFLIAVKALRSDCSGILNLQGSKLSHLDLRDAPVTPEVIQAISKFKNLRYLNLRNTKITGEGLGALATLNQLETLYIVENPLTAEDLRPLAKLPLTGFGFGNTPSELASAAPELGRLFPKLEKLFLPPVFLPPGTLTQADLRAMGAAWPELAEIGAASLTKFEDDTFDALAEIFPNLETLVLWKTKVNDRHIAGIAKHPKILYLRLGETGLTDLALNSLTSMRSLKEVSFDKVSLTDAALAAFKEARPDVKVNR